MTNTPFRGVYPASTTPFHEDGSIDFETPRADVRRLERAGVGGIVPVGSTGESATPTHDEHVEVIEVVADGVPDVPVIAGSGSNDTREALHVREGAPPHLRSPLTHLSEGNREGLRAVPGELAAEPVPGVA